MERIDWRLIGGVADAVVSGTLTSAQKKRKLEDFFNQHMKSKNGVVLGELYVAALKIGVGEKHPIYAAMDGHERMVAQARELVQQRNEKFTLKDIALYLEEFHGYVNAEDIFALFRGAGVGVGEILKEKGFRQEGILEKLRMAGYSARDIAIEIERGVLKEEEGGRMLKAHYMFLALLLAGFGLEEAVRGLRQAGLKGSEVGFGMLMADATVKADAVKAGKIALEELIDSGTIEDVVRTLTLTAMYDADETLFEIRKALKEFGDGSGGRKIERFLLERLKAGLEKRQATGSAMPGFELAGFYPI